MAHSRRGTLQTHPRWDPRERLERLRASTPTARASIVRPRLTRPDRDNSPPIDRLRWRNKALVRALLLAPGTPRATPQILAAHRRALAPTIVRRTLCKRRTQVMPI